MVDDERKDVAELAGIYVSYYNIHVAHEARNLPAGRYLSREEYRKCGVMDSADLKSYLGVQEIVGKERVDWEKFLEDDVEAIKAAVKAQGNVARNLWNVAVRNAESPTEEELEELENVEFMSKEKLAEDFPDIADKLKGQKTAIKKKAEGPAAGNLKEEMQQEMERRERVLQEELKAAEVRNQRIWKEEMEAAEERNRRILREELMAADKRSQKMMENMMEMMRNVGKETAEKQEGQAEGNGQDSGDGVQMEGAANTPSQERATNRSSYKSEGRNGNTENSAVNPADKLNNPDSGIEAIDPKKMESEEKMWHGAPDGHEENEQEKLKRKIKEMEEALRKMERLNSQSPLQNQPIPAEVPSSSQLKERESRIEVKSDSETAYKLNSAGGNSMNSAGDNSETAYKLNSAGANSLNSMVPVTPQIPTQQIPEAMQAPNPKLLNPSVNTRASHPQIDPIHLRQTEIQGQTLIQKCGYFDVPEDCIPVEIISREIREVIREPRLFKGERENWANFKNSFENFLAKTQAVEKSTQLLLLRQFLSGKISQEFEERIEVTNKEFIDLRGYWEEMKIRFGKSEITPFEKDPEAYLSNYAWDGRQASFPVFVKEVEQRSKRWNPEISPKKSAGSFIQKHLPPELISRILARDNTLYRKSPLTNSDILVKEVDEIFTEFMAQGLEPTWSSTWPYYRLRLGQTTIEPVKKSRDSNSEYNPTDQGLETRLHGRNMYRENYRRDFRNQDQTRSEFSRSQSDVICYYCNQKGHRLRFCPERPNGNEESGYNRQEQKYGGENPGHPNYFGSRPTEDRGRQPENRSRYSPWKFCKPCNRPGHTEEECYFRVLPQQQTGQERQTSQPVAAAENQCNYAGSVETEFIKPEVEVSGVKVVALLDTGSCFTGISRSTANRVMERQYNANGDGITIRNDKLLVKGLPANPESPWKMEGKLRGAIIRCYGRSKKMDLWIYEDNSCPYEMMVGVSSIRELGIKLTLDGTDLCGKAQDAINAEKEQEGIENSIQAEAVPSSNLSRENERGIRTDLFGNNGQTVVAGSKKFKGPELDHGALKLKAAAYKLSGNYRKQDGIYETGPERRIWIPICWKCEQKGHLKRDCPKRRKNDVAGGVRKHGDIHGSSRVVDLPNTVGRFSMRPDWRENFAGDCWNSERTRAAEATERDGHQGQIESDEDQSGWIEVCRNKKSRKVPARKKKEYFCLEENM